MWSYDPREGFIIKQVHMDMAGYYDCKARSPSSDVEQSVSLIVTVQSTFLLFLNS